MLLLFSDISAFVLMYVVAIYFIAYVDMTEPKHVVMTNHLALFKLANIVALVILFWRSELYVKRRPHWEELSLILRNMWLIFIADLLVISVLRVPIKSYLAFSLFWFLAFFAIPLFRVMLINFLIKINLWQRNAYIIGTGEHAKEMYKVFRDNPNFAYNVLGFVDVDGCNIKQLDNIIVYSEQEITDLDESAEILVAVDDYISNIVELISYCQNRFSSVSIVPNIHKMPVYGMEINYFFGGDQIIMRLNNKLHRAINVIIKRAFDLLVSICLLPLIFPLLFILSVLIFLTDFANPFFSQVRIGLDGKPFKCLKLRSMHKNAESMLYHWKLNNDPIYKEYIRSNFKLQNDPRVTWIGKFIRKLSLDELPQIINVLFGAMSLVGPRPLMRGEVKRYGYNSSFSYYKLVRPGITGMWQVSGRSDTTFEERVRLDVWYVKNWSLWYDVVILLKTVLVLLFRRGAY